MASSRSSRGSSDRNGWAGVVGVMIVLGLIVEYWYVVVPIVLGIAAMALWLSDRGRRNARRAALHRPGPLDPWLNEVNVALADLEFAEQARNQRSQIGGVPVAGQIELRSRRLTVDIMMLGSEQATHRAEMALRADAATREEIARGVRLVTAREGVLYVATGRGTVVDEPLLDEAVRVVDALPVDAVPAAGAGAGAAEAPAAGARTGTTTSTGATRAAGPAHVPPAGDDPLELLRRLAELHRDGALDDAEFAAKKTTLLKRV